MSELISGKEALVALANGVKPSEIEGMFAAGLGDSLYLSIDGRVDLCVKHLNEKLFRLKPRTITINGIKVSKPQSIRWGGPERCRVEFDFDSEKEAESFYRNFTNEVFK